MEYLEQSVALAMESGDWRPRGREDVFFASRVMGGVAFNLTDSTREFAFHMLWQEIGLDPSFWQALGKARGWDNLMVEGQFGKKMHMNSKCFCDNPEQYFMHRLVDHIVKGKDAEIFFKTLYEQKA